MKKRGVRIMVIIAIIFALVLLWFAFCGYQWSWGSFARLHDLKTARLAGNADGYDLDTIQPLDDSPLEGKRLVFLGSSVTYGAAAQGMSFTDYIGARNNCEVVKEAVSGTTLVDSGLDSYISRMKKLDRNMTADLFVCQLSTNDATQKKNLGNVSESFDLGDFDTKTVAGAIEYIIAYARENWDCPVVFYTNPKYDSEIYAGMVALLHEISEKWDITVIDMWSDTDFNEISPEQRELYLADSIHPTKAGYLQWWTPYMEKAICEVVENGKGN